MPHFSLPPGFGVLECSWLVVSTCASTLCLPSFDFCPTLRSYSFFISFFQHYALDVMRTNVLACVSEDVDGIGDEVIDEVVDEVVDEVRGSEVQSRCKCGWWCGGGP